MELQHLTRLGKRIGLSVIFLSLIPASIVKAQVVPDGTLKSTVETIQELMKIDGGLTEGSNLFHSFEEFNIPEGMEASFENALEIENIFTRVTGDSASTINGTLSAQGGANLFLMNPNGIVFGQDASINIGGSFIATTADNIQFQDGAEFAASPTEDPTPLLTNEIPIGLGFGSYSNSGAITVNGAGNQLTQEATNEPTSVDTSLNGLQVDAGNTLGLIGNSINIDGGIINPSDANVELIGATEGLVSIEDLNDALGFSSEEVVSSGDVSLSQQALVGNNGRVNVSGNNLSITDGSKIISLNQDDSEGSNISINADSSLTLNGITPSSDDVRSGIQADTVGVGRAGDIDIKTPELVLKDGARIGANTFGDGNGGNVSIEADSINLSENPIIINASTYGAGDAGSIDVNTNNLKVADGGLISSATRGSGRGGNVSVNANDIELTGATPEVGNFSSISALSLAEGDAGSVNVDTSTLRISDGGAVSTTAVAGGSAGNTTVNASESIRVEGDAGQESSISSSVFAVPNFEPTGNAGKLSINTPSLTIANGAVVGVNNQGAGEGGNLFISSENIELDTEGSISSATVSGQGGNITIDTDNLQIDNQSTIEATADNQGGGGNININATNITAKKNSDISANAEGGDGGNITIDTETLLGLDNSDITANAVEGDGGNINITATSILGFEERPELTPLSDITASSDFGVDGTVTINSPETNAEEDVQVSAKKPETPLTPLEFVKGCQLPEGILTTRGRGVPESPYPFPFGHLSYDEDVYKKAEETLKRERLRQQREEQKNGISKREAEERRQERELAMLREKQRLLPNRHAHLKYEVTDDREVGPMLLPAPQGRLVGDPDGRTDKNAIPIFYSQSNELPPISQEKRLRQEGNVLVINPDGSQHFVRMFLMSHPTEEMCQNTVGRN